MCTKDFFLSGIHIQRPSMSAGCMNVRTARCLWCCWMYVWSHSASGLWRFSLWCLRVRPGVSLLPVLVTWLLPVAGTTYKPAVIKVFDLLSLPAETHISRPANTALLPPWSMTEGEARATNWQCRDWTRGCGDGKGRAARVHGEEKLVERKSEWDSCEVKADEINWGMCRLHVGLHIWKKTSKSRYWPLQSSC